MEPNRFFFVHLNRTAGISVLGQVRRHFGRAAVYPDETDGSPPDVVLVVDHLVRRWNVRKDELRVITGHFPLCTTEVLGAPFTTFTLLRDPIERTLSHLRSRREDGDAERDVPLETIYDEPIRFHGLVHNHMVKMYALTPEEMTNGAMTRIDFTRDHLERAKERLMTIDTIGLQERFDDFCDALSSAYGWNLGAPMHTRRTQPVEVDDRLRDRIAEDNALDIELYEFARGLVDERQETLSR